MEDNQDEVEEIQSDCGVNGETIWLPWLDDNGMPTAVQVPLSEFLERIATM